MARSMFSRGMLFALASATMVRRRGFMSGSPPPARAATVNSLMSRVKIFPRLASAAPFLCLMECHLEWPDITGKFYQRSVEQAVPMFSVREMAASLQFYTDRLGFRMTRQWVDRGVLRWCWLEFDGAAVMLQTFWTEGPHRGLYGPSRRVAWPPPSGLSATACG